MAVSKALGHLLGVDLEKTSTTALFALGTHVELEHGGKAIYVKANTAITGEGYCVLFDTAFGTDMITTTNADAKLGQRIGFAQCAFAALDYGWVIVTGKTLMQVSASCAANVELTTTATAGQLDDATTTNLTCIAGAVLLVARSGTAGTAAGECREAACGIEHA